MLIGHTILRQASNGSFSRWMRQISDISEIDPPMFGPTAVGYSPGCFMILKGNKNILVAVSLLARIAPRDYITATAAVLQLYSKITYRTNSKTSVKIC